MTKLLHSYLRTRRADLLGKLDGLSEYDARRPMTATGTNLLGLVKHVASVELRYLGEVFGLPRGVELPWFADDAGPDADLRVTADETREQIIGLHCLSAAHADATIEALPLDAPGEVPWWTGERRHVTLPQILVHMGVETAHHLGHADILRELIDRTAGQRPDDPNLSRRTPDEWAVHCAAIEAAARQASAAGDQP